MTIPKLHTFPTIWSWWFHVFCSSSGRAVVPAEGGSDLLSFFARLTKDSGDRVSIANHYFQVDDSRYLFVREKKRKAARDERAVEIHFVGLTS